MIVRKVLLAACAAALTTSPAWALPSGAPSNDGTAHAPATTPAGPPSTTPVGPPSTTPVGRSSSTGHGPGTQDTGPGSHPSKPSHPGQSHKCRAHKVAYVAAGTLVSQTLVAESDGTYSGDVAVAVTRTNHHARADKGTTRTYTVDHAHVVFGVADANSDGTVGLDDVQAGARVRVIGKVTTLAKRCDQSGFAAQLTIRKVVFQAPPAPAS